MAVVLARREAAGFAVRVLLALVPLERDVAFFGVRVRVGVAVLLAAFRVPAGRALREAVADFAREAVPAFAREAVPDLARVAVPALARAAVPVFARVPVEAFVRVAALRLLEAALVRLVPDFDAAGFLADAVLRPVAPVVDRLRLAVAVRAVFEAAPLRPPLAAAAVRPAAPRAELPDAFRAPEAALVRVDLLAGAAFGLAAALGLSEEVARRAGARRRRGCSSVRCSAPASPDASPDASPAWGICSVSSLMR